MLRIVKRALVYLIKQVMMSCIVQSPGRFIYSYRVLNFHKQTGELDKSGQVDGLIRTGKLTGYPAYTPGLSTW